LQDGKLVGIALGAYSSPWEAPLLEDAERMPEVEPPQGREPLSVGPRKGKPPPDFAQRVTMQPRFGDAPFSGGNSGEVGGWMGLIEERPLDALSLAVLADAWFPAPWPRLETFHAAPTIDLTVHFRVALPLEDTLLLGRFRNRMVRDGFFDEDGELWTPDGTLIAQSRQLALLIGAS
jgi:acyl-CoA thioesterase